MTTIEPVNGSNSVFMDRARKLGYKNKSEIGEERKAMLAKDEGKKAHRLNEKKRLRKEMEHRAEFLLSQDIGFKVCKQEGNYY